jgi:hypothetical protein
MHYADSCMHTPTPHTMSTITPTHRKPLPVPPTHQSSNSGRIPQAQEGDANSGRHDYTAMNGKSGFCPSSHAVSVLMLMLFPTYPASRRSSSLQPREQSSPLPSSTAPPHVHPAHRQSVYADSPHAESSLTSQDPTYSVYPPTDPQLAPQRRLPLDNPHGRPLSSYTRSPLPGNSSSTDPAGGCYPSLIYYTITPANHLARHSRLWRTLQPSHVILGVQQWQAHRGFDCPHGCWFGRSCV